MAFIFVSSWCGGGQVLETSLFQKLQATPPWYQAQCGGRSTVKKCPGGKKKVYDVRKKYIFFPFPPSTKPTSCLLDIAFVSRRELKMGCFWKLTILSCCLPFLKGAEGKNKYIKNLSEKKKCSVPVCSLLMTGEKSAFLSWTLAQVYRPLKESQFQLCPYHLIFSSKVIYTWEVSNHLWKI